MVREWIVVKLVFCFVAILSCKPTLAWDYPDPTYGTGDPPNYKKKQSSKNKGSHGSPYVYSSRFNDPYYGTGNPPGYNEKQAKKMGKIYVPPKAEPLPPIYGTGVPNKPSKRRFR